MKTSFSSSALLLVCGAVIPPLLATPSNSWAAAPGPALSGSFSGISAGSVVNLTSEGEIDWIHWGLYAETSLDRKAGVIPQVSDFTLLDAPNGFAFVYQFADNANGYSWSDGTPTAAVNDTTTGVWAYGTPQIGSGFQITAPADTATRTLKIYAGAFGARGKFEAFLSDGSARGYTNTSLFNAANGPGGVFAITYAAASAGQHLIIRWTLSTPLRPDGNVTLQAAALTATNVNNPPFVALTSPANNAAFGAGADITLTAAANDTDGTVATVEFFANGNKIGEDTTSPFNFTWNNVTAGMHVLTARATDSQGAMSDSAPVEIFVNGSGGSLAGSLAVPPVLPGAVNLTSEGSSDWAHWGLATNSVFNHKAGGGQQISDFAKIGPDPVRLYADNYTAYSWSDGTPTPATNGVTRGVFATGVTNGFEFTVPADTTPRTLKVYVGLYGARGNFQAWLSDFSGAAYTDTTLSNSFDNAYGVYTLTYAAASSAQTLTVRYRSLDLFDQDFGNVTLQAATLAVNTGENFSPSVTVTNPLNGAVLTAPATFTLAASASDSDGSVAQVEFFNGNTSLGIDATSPYSVPVNGLSAGSYMLSAVATDNLGARATNAISIIVNNPPTTSLAAPTNGQSFVAPAVIPIAATANDSDGTIAKVEFYANGTKLGEDTSDPYNFVWTNVVAGSYSLTSRATDNRGATATSSPVSITVVSNHVPTVTITMPTNGTVFLAPASFTLAAEASDPDGTVTQVEFFNGPSSLGADPSSGYSVPVNNLGAGSYTLLAVATDNLGATATNSVSIIVNGPPSVILSSPIDGASFTAPANIALSAMATDGGGSIAKVEFFEGINKLGEDASNPYSLTWSNVVAGSYSLTARVTDNFGATATSAVVMISVTNSSALPVTLVNSMWNGSDFSFSFQSQPGHTYEAQYRDSLDGGAWELLTALTGNGEVLAVTNRNVPAGQRFYRVETR